MSIVYMYIIVQIQLSNTFFNILATEGKLLNKVDNLK